MKINWKARVKNKSFWLTLVPAALLFVQTIAAVFGYTLDFGDLGNKLLAVVNAAFAILAVLGIVTDPTTTGIKMCIRDSSQGTSQRYPSRIPCL